MYLRRRFLESIAQTSEIPFLFQPSKAEGVYLYDEQGKAYLDLVSGFSVTNLGHCNEEVTKAITQQARQYMHTTVYGEHLQAPQLELSQLLKAELPGSLSTFFFLNSGSETIDAAIKMARKYKPKGDIVVCKNAYHGSTMAAESLRSDTEHQAAFMPLIPGIRKIEFNSLEDLNGIDDQCAMVILEVVQAEAGVRVAESQWLFELQKVCRRNNVLIAVDEIQTGIGRTGKCFSFQHFDFMPDIVLCGKALGMGLPLSAVIASSELLSLLSHSPVLSYISTFGGNPVCCAAAVAGFKKMRDLNLFEQAARIEEIMRSTFVWNESRYNLRCIGAFGCIELSAQAQLVKILRDLFHHQILVEGFLFCSTGLRIAPPLSIDLKEFEKACITIKQCIDLSLQ